MRATSRSVRVPESTTGSTTLSRPTNRSDGKAGVRSSTGTPARSSLAKRSGAEKLTFISFTRVRSVITEPSRR